MKELRPPHFGFQVLSLVLASLCKAVEEAGLDDVVRLLRQSIEIIKDFDRSLRGVYTQEGGVVVDLTEGRGLLILLSKEQAQSVTTAEGERLFPYGDQEDYAELGAFTIAVKEEDGM